MTGSKGQVGGNVEKKRYKPNIISRIFLCWVCPVLYNGNKRDVEEEDLVRPNKYYDSKFLGDTLEKYWLKECEQALAGNRQPSLLKVLIRAYGWKFFAGTIFLTIYLTMGIIQPLLFSQLLTYWSSTNDQAINQREAGFYALGMLLTNIVGIISQHHNNLFVNRFGLKVKVAVSSLVFRKMLRMSQASLSQVAAGKIVNIMSSDVARFDYAFMFLHYLWLVPIQAAIILYFLYDVAGYAPFVGLFGVILLVLPIQAGLTKLTAIIRRSVAQRTDSRIKLMNEIINGIQVIKMYAWEKSFQKVVQGVRAFELVALSKAVFVRSVFLGFMMYSERTIIFITSLTIILTGGMLSADTIYPIKSFLGIIQINFTFMMPLAIAGFSELLVSLQRIQSILVLDEKEDIKILPQAILPVNGIYKKFSATSDMNTISVKHSPPLEETKSTVDSYVPHENENDIELAEVNASWISTKNPQEMTLKNVTFNVPKGKLVAIVGPVGSGKTSLLHVILRELPICNGNLNLNGSISYACQETWLFPQTVRENIIFGLPYDAQKYKRVCKVCSLLPDFKQFPYGDLSLVGERGVSLSGGQRARINLARAIYRESDIYLLDDPLSAVDANVGRMLFEDCIQRYLNGKTRILVTHQIHLLKPADLIIVVDEGSIKNIGTYNDLVKSEKVFSSLMESKEEKMEKVEARPLVKHSVSMISVRSDDNPEEEREQIQEAEERAKGTLKWSVIAQYMKRVESWFVVFLTIVALLLTQTAGTISDYWLSFWTNQIDEYIRSLPEGILPDPSLETQIGLLTTGQYLWIFGGLILFIIIMTHVRILAFVVLSKRASQNLHNVMFKNLLAAVMRFFDTNPSGRILNRFAKDLSAMDEILPRTLFEAIQMYLFVISALLLNAFALPWTLIPTFILLGVFGILLKWYLNASQAIKRLEGTTKSPVFGMINSTLSGLTTVRSSNSQNMLLEKFDDTQDLNSQAVFTYFGSSVAFGLYLDMLCLVYMGVLFATFILIDFGYLIEVGSVGLAVSQSMSLTVMLQTAARGTSELLGTLTAVERVLEYSRLPSEENMDDGSPQPNNWPSKGEVCFENVTLRYGPEDPPVLRNLNFVIRSGWKVGIVGRTGAGKSSLISALFRLSNIEGSIKIDGIDTVCLSKKDLRSKISIIPQEPVLFSASLRYNLDPFNKYSDDEIWRALEQVELKDSVQALDFQVSEGGANFSVGQRQLVCLARAILGSNKILVMDEATANVDPQTDALIQTTIRKQFISCTVLTIAHRLNTIMDSDRILVMDKGEIAEFDHPFILLSNPQSHLNFMVKETGESMSNQLYETAKTKYYSQSDAISKDK
ncbi:ABC transporter family C protein ABCC2 [Danaus plexippus plexippus]|uniref:ABC transporter family C protein ABCC2 n=1 Tax=Danaus plexippus plexippus TaxID=278856 RepID=A0A212FDD7_DANPL|nr:ABC transporter family C protein ABCC2 [Danaus plexippus plexippus]